MRKLQFDLAQLQYLHSQQRLRLQQLGNEQADGLLGEIQRSHRDAIKYLQDFSLDDPYVRAAFQTSILWKLRFDFLLIRLVILFLSPTQRVVRLNSNAAMKSKGEFLNRLVHLAAEATSTSSSSSGGAGGGGGIPAEALVHAGAMKYLRTIHGELQANDFIVVDVILKEAALQELSRLLLSSTVWFDVTNGAAFASHHDDGLTFRSVQTLVQVQIQFNFDTLNLSIY